MINGKEYSLKTEKLGSGEYCIGYWNGEDVAMAEKCFLISVDYDLNEARKDLEERLKENEIKPGIDNKQYLWGKLSEEEKQEIINKCMEVGDKVKEKLEMRTNSMGMENYIFRVIVPETKEEVEKDGKVKERVKKLFPGYILVEMIMTDEAWFIVRNTPGVTGFIGSSGKGAKPTPLQPYEVDKILGSMGMTRLEAGTDLQPGNKVKVIAGPFNGMEGKIDSLDLANNKVMVLLDLFGQETSVEIMISEIERA